MNLRQIVSSARGTVVAVAGTLGRRFKKLPAAQRHLAFGLTALLGLSGLVLVYDDIEDPLLMVWFFLLALLAFALRVLLHKRLLRSSGHPFVEKAGRRARRQRLSVIALIFAVSVSVVIFLALDLIKSAAVTLIVMAILLGAWVWLSIRTRRAPGREIDSAPSYPQRTEADGTDAPVERVERVERLERLERLATAQLDYLWGFSAIALLVLLLVVDSFRNNFDDAATITTHVAVGVAGIWILVRLLRLSWSVMARKDGGVIVGAALISSAVVMSIVAICFYTVIDEYWGSVREAEYELARARRRETIEAPVAALEPEPAEQIEWRRELPGEYDLLVLTNSDFNPRARGSLYERSAGAVVTLGGRTGHGTAFLVTRDGLALTNEHVVERAERLTARFQDGREAPVRVIRSSADVDVALIQIACVADCLTVPLGTDSEIEPGMDVMVIGTPWEQELHHTATKGVVSALRYEAGMTLVQVDAPINGGNSGSPILDVRTGHTLGIISHSRRGAEDLNFGVSISDALRELGVRVESR